MIAAGTRIGDFEITGHLGAGGMGEVYRARDTRLGREVALKILPEAFAADPDRLMRFEREARTLAALNHPHIAQVYGVEETAGATGGPTRALVMELVEGEDLSQRIARGPLPVDEALTIARQIADALEAAHEQGIIHRDLKPANIKVREDGTVKVLDFGLAKALESRVGNRESGVGNALANSPTITSPAMTQAGVILGTAAYMSPEQAKGRAADTRSDIWAFGCVLYEMLTGRRAFGGDDLTETLAAVVRGDPDWTALPQDTSARVRRVLQRCLQKPRERRLAHIADARFDLDETVDAAAGSTAAPSGQPIRLALAALGVAALGAMVAVAAMWSLRAAPDRPIVRFSLTPPAGWTLAAGLNRFGAVEIPFAVSPDGRSIALLLRNSSGASRLFVRTMDATVPRELPGTDAALGPFWSPDSRFLGFFADGKIKKLDVGGGEPVVVCNVPSFNSASWGPSGVIVFAQSAQHPAPIQKVADSGGTPTPATQLAEEESLHIRPAFLPDGRHFLFRANGPSSVRGVYVTSLDATERSLVFEGTDTSSNVLYTDGHLLYVRGSDLVVQPFDTERRAVAGEPVQVAERVTNAINVGQFSASADGVLAFLTGEGFPETYQLTWFDRSGARVGFVDEGRDAVDVEMSRDGQRVAIATRGSPNIIRRDIWLIGLQRPLRTRFTLHEANEARSVWSPDGRRLVFSSDRNGHVDLFEKSVEGGPETLLLGDSENKVPWSWSPDGGSLMYSTGLEWADLWVLPLSGDRKPYPYLKTATAELFAQFSPDGRWVAYVSGESGAPQVFVSSFPNPSTRVQVSVELGVLPRWRADGRELFYIGPGGLLTVASVETRGARIVFGESRPLFGLPTLRSPNISGFMYAVDPTGQRFLVSVPAVDVTLDPVTVVINGTAGIR